MWRDNSLFNIHSHVKYAQWAMFNTKTNFYTVCIILFSHSMVIFEFISYEKTNLNYKKYEVLVTIQNMVPCLYKKFYYCYNLYFLTLSLTALLCFSLHKANIHVDNVYICDSLQQKVPWVVLHLCLIHKHKPINNQYFKRMKNLCNSGLSPLMTYIPFLAGH